MRSKSVKTSHLVYRERWLCPSINKEGNRSLGRLRDEPARFPHDPLIPGLVLLKRVLAVHWDRFACDRADILLGKGGKCSQAKHHQDSNVHLRTSLFFLSFTVRLRQAQPLHEAAA